MSTGYSVRSADRAHPLGELSASRRHRRISRPFKADNSKMRPTSTIPGIAAAKQQSLDPRCGGARQDLPRHASAGRRRASGPSRNGDGSAPPDHFWEAGRTLRSSRLAPDISRQDALRVAQDAVRMGVRRVQGDRRLLKGRREFAEHPVEVRDGLLVARGVADWDGKPVARGHVEQHQTPDPWLDHQLKRQRDTVGRHGHTGIEKWRRPSVAATVVSRAGTPASTCRHLSAPSARYRFSEPGTS